MAGLNMGGTRFTGDNGAADPRITTVLAAYGAGRESEQAVLTALAGSRLLVPLVQAPAAAADSADSAEAGGACATDDAHAEACATGDAHDDGCDHQAARQLAFPTLIGRDGRPALLAFTSLAALVSWRPDARPVPTPAEQVWGTAVGDSCAVVIDVAGPVPIAVDGARLSALAAGGPPPAPHDDPDLRADVAAALATLPAAAGEPGASGPSVVGAELGVGPDGTDLAVRLLIRPAPQGPQDTKDPRAAQAAAQRAVQEVVQQAAEAIAGRLAGRLRRGIQFSAAHAPATAAAPAASSAPVPSRPHG